MLTLALIILALWLLGVIVNVGSFIHLLLIIGLIILLIDLIGGRSRHTV